MAYIDPSNTCNYNCPLCPSGSSGKQRRKTIMKLHDFKIILDQIGNFLYSLHLYNWGEPFLNKDLPEMIKYAKKFDIKVLVSTNLSIMDNKFAKGIIESGLDCLTVSLDGISNKTYEKYRIGGNLKRVLNNLNMLLDMKRKMNSCKPDIVIQFLVNRYNENEVQKVKDYAKKLGVFFSIEKLRLGIDDEFKKTKDDISQFKDWLPINRDLSLYDNNLEKESSNFCYWPWERICIHPDGSVSPCCSVYSEKYDFGNILKIGFPAVWNGRKYRDARNIVRKKKLNEDLNMPCNYCVEKGEFLDFQPKY